MPDKKTCTACYEDDEGFERSLEEVVLRTGRPALLTLCNMVASCPEATVLESGRDEQDREDDDDANGKRAQYRT